MKKILCIICLVFLLISLIGCDGTQKQITVAEAGYSCDGIVSYGENFSSEITVSAVGGGLFTVKINKPDNLLGLTFSFDNSELSISYNGLEYSEFLPVEYGGFAEILNEIFLKFTTSRPVVSFKDGKYLLEGNNSKYLFTVTFNEDGFPLDLNVKDENLKVTFSNWKY